MYAIIICCYWTITKDRTWEELKWLHEFFSWISDYIEQEMSNIDCIVFSGWYTDKKHPWLSEAYSSYRFLQKNFIREFAEHISIYYEQNSIITWENLIFSLLLLRRNKPTKITVFCDSVRQEKVDTEIQLIWKNLNISTHTIWISRTDTHPNSTYENQLKALQRDISNPHFHNMIRFLESQYNT